MLHQQFDTRYFHAKWCINFSFLLFSFSLFRGIILYFILTHHVLKFGSLGSLLFVLLSGCCFSWIRSTSGVKCHIGAATVIITIIYCYTNIQDVKQLQWDLGWLHFRQYGYKTIYSRYILIVPFIIGFVKSFSWCMFYIEFGSNEPVGN